LESLQATIKQYRQRWSAAGQWKDPGVTDAVLFAMTELGEATDQLIRLKKAGYTRNNDRDATADKLATELFDCIMMCTIALDELGVDLETVAAAKLEKMDRKRMGEQ